MSYDVKYFPFSFLERKEEDLSEYILEGLSMIY